MFATRPEGDTCGRSNRSRVRLLRQGGGGNSPATHRPAELSPRCLRQAPNRHHVEGPQTQTGPQAEVERTRPLGTSSHHTPSRRPDLQAPKVLRAHVEDRPTRPQGHLYLGRGERGTPSAPRPAPHVDRTPHDLYLPGSLEAVHGPIQQRAHGYLAGVRAPSCPWHPRARWCVGTNIRNPFPCRPDRAGCPGALVRRSAAR